HAAEMDALTALGVLPSQVVSLDKGEHLALQILPLISADADHFACRQHQRQDGKRLRCFSAIVESLNSVAIAGAYGDGTYALVDAAHIARMACICDRLTPAIHQVGEKNSEGELARDPGLVGLLRRFKTPSWDDAEEVAKRFPDVMSQGASFGGYMAF